VTTTAPGATTLRAVGTSAVRAGGAERVSGEQLFLADLRLGGMLHVKLVHVDCARARIDAVDATAARAVPGVVDVVTAADLPQPVQRFGPVFADRPILAVGETKHHGEAVAAVVARTRDAAEEGARQVRVTHEVLPAVLTTTAALAPDAPWSSTRTGAQATPWPTATSSRSGATAGATSTPPPPTSSSRTPTPSRWSPTSRSNPTARSRSQTTTAA
jgi:CO/xanthine dehydrogenase Mo-binding subunit